jgi:hypothetical protein
VQAACDLSVKAIIVTIIVIINTSFRSAPRRAASNPIAYVALRDRHRYHHRHLPSPSPSSFQPLQDSALDEVAVAVASVSKLLI